MAEPTAPAAASGPAPLDLTRVGGFSGYPVYGRRSYPGSDEYHRQLQGTAADRKNREILDNHGLTSTAFRLLTQLAQQVQFSIAPATEPMPPRTTMVKAISTNALPA